MHYPHRKLEADTHGRSPGNGMTPTLLSRTPLATEGEATPGPDDETPYEPAHAPRATADGPRMDPDPTAGADPFVFDDVGRAVDDVTLPGLDALGDGPRF